MPDFVVKRIATGLYHTVEMAPAPERIPKEERALEVARITISNELARVPLAHLIKAYKAGVDLTKLGPPFVIERVAHIEEPLPPGHTLDGKNRMEAMG